MNLPIFCKPLLLLLIIHATTACNNQDKNGSGEPAIKTVDPPATDKQLVFDKLTGTWGSANGKNFERWTKNKDGTYTAVAFSVKGADTTWNEQARVYQENDTWIFENTVRGQNDDKSVRFTSSLLEENRVQFSNPAHDFPTDINYTLPDANTIQAYIVGPNEKGGKDTILFNYARIK